MILIPHIFWNGQAVSYPAAPLIANVYVNSKKHQKTLLLSPIPQEKDFSFVLQTEITFILVLLGNKAYVITVLVLQATITNKSRAREQTTAQFANYSVFYTSNCFCTHKSQD